MVPTGRIRCIMSFCQSRLIFSSLWHCDSQRLQLWIEPVGLEAFRWPNWKCWEMLRSAGNKNLTCRQHIDGAEASRGKKTIWRRQSKSRKKMGSNMEHHGASFYFKSCWVPVSIIPNHSSDSAAKKGKIMENLWTPVIPVDCQWTKRANFNHELWMFDECSMINSWLPCDLVWSHVVLCRVVLPLQDRRLGASKLQILVTLWAPFLDLKNP